MAWACQLRNSGRKGRFRQVEQYVVLLLLLMLCWESRKLRTRATEVDDFLDALARQVKMIANKSVQNAAQACGTSCLLCLTVNLQTDRALMISGRCGRLFVALSGSEKVVARC